MNKKLQVFVSSTYTDLIEERQAAVQAILDAGHIPAGMELFKAGKSQMETIKKWIDESDVYMLILGGRYGSIEEESGLSYTELEYRYALSKNMPVFAIVLNDNFLHIKAASFGADAIFEKNQINKYTNFKDYVKTNIVIFADNNSKILSIVHSHLNYILSNNDYHLIGWTRNTLNQNRSVNFQTLSYTFSKIIIYISNDNKVKMNANEYFINKMAYFNVGVSKSLHQFLYYHYSKIYLLNELLEKTKNEKGEEMFQLSKLGSEYCNYLIENKVV